METRPKQSPKVPKATPASRQTQPFFGQKKGLVSDSFFRKTDEQVSFDTNTSGDTFEQEADSMAGQVVNQTNSAEPGLIQRKETDSSAETSVDAGFSRQLDSTKGAGFTLQPALQNRMETAFGADFSPVRLHTGLQAEQMSKQINAQAFTLGNDVYFNAGKYEPASLNGQKLLAHELTHVVQQRSSVQRKTIQRAVAEADVEAEYGKWAAANKKTTDRTKDDFPMDVWDFIRPQLVDSATMEPLPKPTDPKKLKEWTNAFEKGEIIARWLLTIRAGAASDTLKDFADSRALMVLDALAKAGMVSKAMNQSSGLSADRRKFLYDTVLKNPSSASPAELVTIIAFQGSSIADPASVPIVQLLTDGNANDLKKLNAAQTKAMFGVLIKMYGNNALIIKAIAEVLMFNPAVRVAVSDALMKGEIGNRDLLFAVLKHPYFVEPGYEGGLYLKALVPAGKTDEDYNNDRMKTDMPWVYTYKQKYYVQYLIDLAKAQSIVIPAPAKLDFTSLKPWLETNTEKIGEAAKKTHPSDPKAVFDIYRNIADIFFYHIPHDRDVAPDLEGKISHLQPGNPSKARFEADCDVFATYAMRLFFNAGFEPVGYLAIVPVGADSKRSAHVTALMRKDNAYYIINNKGILDPKQTETKPNEKKQDALKSLFKLALRDAYEDTPQNPLPTEMKLYYEDAGPKGQMSQAFKNQDSSLERTDIK